jgi:hypothetical protein
LYEAATMVFLVTEKTHVLPLQCVLPLSMPFVFGVEDYVVDKKNMEASPRNIVHAPSRALRKANERLRCKMLLRF